MAIRCPKCGHAHDVTKFEGAAGVKCECGQALDLSLIETIDDFLRFFESEDERKKAREIAHDADRICRMIIDGISPKVDIEIEQAKLRDKVRALFPAGVETYEMIYEARFKRLWDQFRDSDSTPD
ncbi:MAG: hypothetical protein Q8R76_04165 [Candidatus Omnitrophota bacterium]|nr:hypothetical protein [Candidatus Omnitrophota bacterium]